MTHLRRDVDDRTGKFFLDQPLGHRLRHEESGAHIQPHDGVEVLDLDVDQRRRPVHAGIVDQHLKRRACGKRCLDGGDIGDVERQRVGLLAARADRRRRFLDFGRRACGQRHMRAGVGQRGGGGETDAAPGAGDQRALAVEAEGGGRGEFNGHRMSAFLSLP